MSSSTSTFITPPEALASFGMFAFSPALSLLLLPIIKQFALSQCSSPDQIGKIPLYIKILLCVSSSIPQHLVPTYSYLFQPMRSYSSSSITFYSTEWLHLPLWTLKCLKKTKGTEIQSWKNNNQWWFVLRKTSRSSLCSAIQVNGYKKQLLCSKPVLENKPNSTKAHGFKSNHWDQIYLQKNPQKLIQMLRLLTQSHQQNLQNNFQLSVFLQSKQH